MKKSFKWLWCVALVGCLFAAGCKEEEVHEHEYASTYSYDQNGHWIALLCEGHTDQRINLSTHNGMEDGICDTCSYDAHEGKGHTYATELSHDDVNHWYDVTCGHEAELKKVAHIDVNNDKLCDVQGCGYDYNHTHTYATEWSGDTMAHWHEADCGCSIEAVDKEAHVDADKNGVCDICELKTHGEDHVHTNTTDWSSDEDNHWHAATCGHDALVSGKEGHVGMNGDGVCDTCGYDVTAYGHTHAYAPEWSHNETQHWHAASCGHSALIDGVADHVDANNDKACDDCGYDGGHIHTYANVDELSSDENGHWIAAICGCDLKVSEYAHSGMEDGVCDDCDWYDVEHTCEPGDWKTDEYSHWKECADHSAVRFEEGNHDGMNDGICDTCGYKDYAEDHVHTYNTAEEEGWTSDYNGHWLNSNCGHDLVKEGSYAAHVDALDKSGEMEVEGSDGLCDICEHETFDAVIDNVLNLAQNVGTGVVNDGYTDYFFEIGDDYLHTMDLDDFYNFWYYDYNGEMIAISDRGYGLESNYSANPNNTQGFYFSLGLDSTYNWCGTENTIASLWELAKTASNVNISYENGVYTLSFEIVVDYYYYVSRTSVSAEFEISNGYLDGSYLDYVSYFAVTAGYDSYEAEQRLSFQNARSPFDPADFFVSDYDIMNGDEVVTEETVITIEKGANVQLPIVNVLCETQNFDFDELRSAFTNADGETVDTLGAYAGENWETGAFVLTINANSAAAGTYTITLTTANTTKSFTIMITAPTVSEFSTVVRVDGSRELTTEATTYVGEAFEFGVKTNNYADNSYTAEVTSANADKATLTIPEVTKNDGEWAYGYSMESSVVFSEAGEYTIVVTSTVDASFTATITVTVVEPPKVEDVLKGDLAWEDGSGASIHVTLTPETEGALNGTATITTVVDEGNWYPSWVTTTYENVTYAYNAETNAIDLTLDGAAFTDVEISWNNELNVVFGFTAWMPYEGTLEPSEPYAPPAAEDAVAGEYVASGEYEYTVMLNADGTGTYLAITFDDNWVETTVEEATFTFTAEDNGDGTYSITIANVEGTSIQAGTYAVQETETMWGGTVMQIIDLAIGDTTITFDIW